MNKCDDTIYCPRQCAEVGLHHLYANVFTKHISLGNMVHHNCEGKRSMLGQMLGSNRRFRVVWEFNLSCLMSDIFP